MDSRTIGVISDTHGHFDPKIEKLFAGVELILHAGDIGTPWVILQLEAIAPITAVLGNTDADLDYKETEVAQVDSRVFLIHHIVDMNAPSEEVQALIRKKKADVVVFGHTHRPFCEKRGSVLYFNPGYAGKPRFNLPRTVALLHCAKNEITPEFLPLG